MNSENPYLAPMADAPYAGRETEDRRYFKDLGYRQLRKLYLRSCNISVVAGLLVISCVALGLLAALRPTLVLPIIIAHWWVCALLLFQIIGALALMKRSERGRRMGFVICVLFCFSSILGIVIGLFGLVALIKCPELFGPDRILHADLKAEYKRRKQGRIFV